MNDGAGHGGACGVAHDAGDRHIGDRCDGVLTNGGCQRRGRDEQRGRQYYGGQGQIIKRETIKTDATGKAILTFDTPRENYNQDFEYRIEARVTDSSRREIVASDNVRVTRPSDLLVAQAIDYAQPNAIITGGYSQCVKIAGLANAFNVSIANGGAWGFHNMHLQAGVSNGTLVEHHYLAVELYKQIYRGLPEPVGGYFAMPEAPGLGFEPDRDAIREIAKLPLSQGRGKG